jgi:hypothetical protein
MLVSKSSVTLLLITLALATACGQTDAKSQARRSHVASLGSDDPSVAAKAAMPNVGPAQFNTPKQPGEIRITAIGAQFLPADANARTSITSAQAIIDVLNSGARPDLASLPAPSISMMTYNNFVEGNIGADGQVALAYQGVLVWLLDWHDARLEWYGPIGMTPPSGAPSTCDLIAAVNATTGRVLTQTQTCGTD